MENTQVSKEELIKTSPEFNTLLDEAANYKKEILTSYKTQTKQNYDLFYDAMLHARRDIESILDKPKKHRTDEENDKVKAFKKETSVTFKSCCDLLMPEELEEGQLSKFDKIVDKVAKVFCMLQYIGNHQLQDAFAKRGLEVRSIAGTLEDQYEAFQNEHLKTNITKSIETGVRIKTGIKDSSDAIKSDKYEQIPQELYYDKDNNPAGIKPADFSKLVDIKAKLIIASTPDAVDKVCEKANGLAGDKSFDIERSKIIQSKIINIIDNVQDTPEE